MWGLYLILFIDEKDSPVMMEMVILATEWFQMIQIQQKRHLYNPKDPQGEVMKFFMNGSTLFDLQAMNESSINDSENKLHTTLQWSHLASNLKRSRKSMCDDYEPIQNQTVIHDNKWRKSTPYIELKTKVSQSGLVCSNTASRPCFLCPTNLTFSITHLGIFQSLEHPSTASGV